MDCKVFTERSLGSAALAVLRENDLGGWKHPDALPARAGLASLPRGGGRLRVANLALLDRPTAQFADYFEPYTADPLGSLRQSWTAAVTLDWLEP